MFMYKECRCDINDIMGQTFYREKKARKSVVLDLHDT